MVPHEILALFEVVAAGLRAELATAVLTEEVGARVGQYAFDLKADELVVNPILEAGFAVLSEESGLQSPSENTSEITVVVDPIDGSTNASIGIPFYALSLCAVDAEGPLVALVTNLATGVNYSAIRGEGAFRDGTKLQVRDTQHIGNAIVFLNGLPPKHLGWKQFRAMGAASLELCHIAEGSVDAYLNCVPNSHGSWDYLGGALVIREAGGTVVDLEGRDLVAMRHDDRRTIVAACTQDLCTQLVDRLSDLPGETS